MNLHPVAQAVKSYGRGPDSMLVHMSPREVGGLQALAMANGGSLTINPETGLPEAGFLDKLLPAIIGFALGPAGFALMSPVAAGLTVGGIQALRTGDLGKGITAGLGAWGGAGIGAGLNSLGAEQMAAAVPSGGPPIGLNPAATTAATEAAAAAANASKMQLLKEGAKAAWNDPSKFISAMGGGKDALMAAGAAAAPILADQAVQSGMPTTTTTSKIRRFTFDPYTGTYSPAGIYSAAQPTYAAQGGIASLARGGVATFADGGDILSNLPTDWSTYTPDQKIAYYNQQLITPDQLIGAGVAQGDIDWMQQHGYGGDTFSALPTDWSTYAPEQKIAYYNENKITPDMLQSIGVAQGDIDWMQQHGYGAPVYDWRSEIYSQDPSIAYQFAQANNVDMNANINKYLAENPFATAAEIEAQKQEWNFSDEDILRALEASGASGATQWGLTHGRGLNDIQTNILNWFRDNPNATQAELDAAKEYWETSTSDVQSPYAQALTVDAANKASGELYIRQNPDVAAWLRSADGQAYLTANQGLSAEDIAWTHYQRYGKTEGREWPTATPIEEITRADFNARVGEQPPDLTYTNAETGRVVTTPRESFTPAVGGSSGPAVVGGGTVINPNGTITTSPRIPGIPVGGFTGMQNVRDVYTQSGGRLGGITQGMTSEQLYNKYLAPMTRGDRTETPTDSKAAYDYLMGKGPYPTRTTAQEIFRPYTDILGTTATRGVDADGRPTYNLTDAARATRKFIFDPTTVTYNLNPDYREPFWVEGERILRPPVKDIDAAFDAALATTEEDKSGDAALQAMLDAGQFTIQEIADRLGISLEDAKKRFKITTEDEEIQPNKVNPHDPNFVGESNSAGGIIGLAKGGLAQGSFVVPADVLSAAGNGSTKAGLAAINDKLMKKGVGRASLISGNGDGLSDSIPTSIEGVKPARVADGEAYIDPRTVKRLGGGDAKKGAAKLYAMMDRIRKQAHGSTKQQRPVNVAKALA